MSCSPPPPPSYEGLRAQLYQLQKEILTLSGEDPLRDVYVGNPRPKAKAKNLEGGCWQDWIQAVYTCTSLSLSLSLSLSTVKHSVYIKSSNKSVWSCFDHLIYYGSV